MPKTTLNVERNNIGKSGKAKENGEAFDIITITRGVAQGNTISPLTFAVIKETVAKWIAAEC